jgi:hypothetical protein
MNGMNQLLKQIRKNYIISYWLYPWYLLALIQNRRWKPETFEDIDKQHTRTIFLQHVRDYMKVNLKVTEKHLENI